MDVCIISALLKRSFSSRGLQDQREMIEKGRPTPDLAITQKNKSFTRRFHLREYEATKWLAGSAVTNRLYCWPCLLFNPVAVGSLRWTKEGYSDLKNIKSAIAKHQTSANHMRSTLSLASFKSGSIKSAFCEAEVLRRSVHNDQVRRNIEILHRLIQAVCFLVRQELPFRGHDESSTSMNRGNYVELLHLLCNFDAPLGEHLQTNRVFTGTSSKIQNDLISAIRSTVTDCIKKKVRESKFVSVMADETTDVQNKSQLSIVLRLVTQSGKCVEHFLNFYDVSRDKTAAALSNIILGEIRDLDCKDKVIAQTYDGAAVMASHINGVQAKVKAEIPHALFVHCSAHVLNLVLSRSVESIKSCKIFFATIEGLSAFFSHSAKRCAALDQMVRRRLPRVAPTRWSSQSRLVNVVYDERSELCEFFNTVIESPDIWDKETLLRAEGFKHKLHDFSFNFLLILFHRIFERTDILFSILQKKELDPTYCTSRLEEFTEWLRSNVDDFDDYMARTNSLQLDSVHLSRNREHYHHIFRDIHIEIGKQMDIRFKSLTKLTFFQLLDPKRFSEFEKNFPEKLLQSVGDFYGSFFDLPKLSSELKVVYATKDIVGKYPHEIIAFLSDKELDSCFTELDKLGSVISCIPVTSSSVERSFSVLKRIKSTTRNSMTQCRLNDLSFLSIEKETLDELQKQPNFLSSVVSHFTKKDRRMDFLYQ